MTRYSDETATLDDAGMHITDFFHPGNRRTIPYESIENTTVILVEHTLAFGLVASTAKLRR